jgi:hypothetical protein
VLLMASKTWNGHAEPAAGLVALLHAQQALLRSAALPLLHLRHINPYVAAALAEADTASEGWACVSRQSGGGGGAQKLCGVSAFAFQACTAKPCSRFWRAHCSFDMNVATSYSMPVACITLCRHH